MEDRNLADVDLYSFDLKLDSVTHASELHEVLLERTALVGFPVDPLIHKAEDLPP